MKKLILGFLIICFCIIFNACDNKASKKIEKQDGLPQIAVLGMLHFVSKNNTISQKFNDVKSNKRQKEINDLVDLLKSYRPTKIAVERPYRSDEELNERYKNYLNGNYELTAEETDQIAFRLGKELHHKRLYLAYYPVQYAFDSAVTFAKYNQQHTIIDSIISNAKEIADQYDKIAKSSSIIDAVYYLNTEKAIQKNHYGYLLLSQIGNKENKIGADAVGDWYKSNIKIFDNIRQLANSPSDRILVIYGQGHCKILNQLIEDSPGLQLVDIKDYLK